MCLRCHMSMSPETAVKSLKKYIENPRFEKWTTTSFHHILLHIRGLDGDEAHDLACQLIEMFFNWYLGWSNGLWQMFYSYNPCLGTFPHSDEMRKMVNEAKQFYQEYKGKTREEMINIMVEENKTYHDDYKEDNCQ